MDAGYAFEKARVVVHNILYDKEKVFDPKKMPVIFSAYQIGFIGSIRDAEVFATKPLSINPKAYITEKKRVFQKSKNFFSKSKLTG
jgi:dihydrolipoamide dehydrogenase